MTGSRSSLPRLFAEMKRRKVFRVMAAYGIIGFGVIEAAEAIFPRVVLPDWTVTFVVWLTLLGFPIAVVLAWAFDSTPDGVKRTADATDAEIAEIIAQPASKRWMPGLLALAGAALLFGGWWMGRQTSGPELGVPEAQAADFRTVAVLPFEDLGGNEENDPLLKSFHVAVIDRLSVLGDLRITNPASVQGYANTTKDTRTIAGELADVDFVIRGSVVRAGTQAKINVRLEDVATNRGIESILDETVSVTVENLFAVQGRIARQVADLLEARLTPQDIERLEAGLSTTNPEAINAYHRARAEWRGSRGSPEEVLIPLQRAVAIAPEFVEAWSFMAHVESFWAQVDREQRAPALEALLQAERLAPNSFEAVKARGWYTYYVENDFERALELMREAERRAPSDGEVVAGIGFILHRLGEFEEGNQEIKRAVDLDPLNAGRLANLVEALGRVAKWHAADVVAERVLAVDPSNTRGQWYKALLVLRREREPGHARRLADAMGPSAENYGEAGSFEFALMERDYDTAARIVADALVEDDENHLPAREPNYLALWAWVEQQREGSPASVLDSLRVVIGPDSSVTGVYRLKQAAARMVLGEEEVGFDLLSEIVEEARSSDDRLSRIADLWEAARVYAQFERTEEALALLDEAVAQPTMYWWSAAELELDPRFDSLRDDPRFDALVARQQAYEEAQAREAENEDWLP